MEKRCSSPNGFINLEIIAIEKEKKMKSGRKVMRSGVVLAVVAVCLLGRVVPGRAQEDNLKEVCSNDFEKVGWEEKLVREWLTLELFK